MLGGGVAEDCCANQLAALSFCIFTSPNDLCSYVMFTEDKRYTGKHGVVPEHFNGENIDAASISLLRSNSERPRRSSLADYSAPIPERRSVVSALAPAQSWEGQPPKGEPDEFEPLLTGSGEPSPTAEGLRQRRPQGEEKHDDS